MFFGEWICSQCLSSMNALMVPLRSSMLAVPMEVDLGHDSRAIVGLLEYSLAKPPLRQLFMVQNTLL
jgi:hypothetical protein